METMRRPLPPHPGCFEDAAFIHTELMSGRPIEEAIDTMIVQLYAPTTIVRSVREGAAVDMATAKQLVEQRLAPSRRSELADLWSRVDDELGTSIDALLPNVSRVLAMSDEPADSSGPDLDLQDIAETLAIERLRQHGGEPTGVRMLESLVLAALGPIDAQHPRLLSVAIDRLNCPTELLSCLLAAAEALDASACRFPLATIVRTHGTAPVELRRDYMAASTSPDQRSAAAKWAYWLRADWSRPA
jgi:hypothetical protein